MVVFLLCNSQKHAHPPLASFNVNCFCISYSIWGELDKLVAAFWGMFCRVLSTFRWLMELPVLPYLRDSCILIVGAKQLTAAPLY